MGWFRPDLFRRLIAYSGTFVDQQDHDAAEEAKYPLGAWEYHSGMKLIENTEKKPLRIFTHVRKRSSPERCGGNPSQLGDGRRTHRGCAQGQRLQPPLRIQPGHGPLRPPRFRANTGGYARVDLARLPRRVSDLRQSR